MTDMKKIILAALAVLLMLPAEGQKRIRFACIGDSVTYGAGLSDRDNDAYPVKLQALLGDGYDVRNFGRNGATLLRKGHRPYNELPEYEAALAFAPDYVVIHLGLNDTDPRNWPNYRDEFIPDYLQLIEDFRKANPSAKIWICRMTPIFPGHPRFESGTRDWFWEEQAAIERVAEISGAGLVDLHSPQYRHPDYYRDYLHPDSRGTALMAETVYSAVTGDYGGLQMPLTYTHGMVLQRGKVLRISGLANAGETVAVWLGKAGPHRIGQPQERTTMAEGGAEAGADGRWTVEIGPLEACTGLTLTIGTIKRRLNYEDVAVGEVWLCSGQSNMEFPTSGMSPEERDTLLAFAAGRPDVRLLNMKENWHVHGEQWSTGKLDSLTAFKFFSTGRWERLTPENADGFSAVGLSFGKMLSDSLKVPIGLILNAVGGSPAESWTDRKTLEFEFPGLFRDWWHNDFFMDWVRKTALTNTSARPDLFQRHPYEPSYLFEAGIQPLERYPIKGVVWYQGESNAHNPEAYDRLFRLMLKSWRGWWGENLPFHFVQLSGIDRPSWPYFRDLQRRLAKELPRCYMTVSSDRGDSLDVHPRRKLEVGSRMARQALREEYAWPISVAEGPSFTFVQLERDRAVVHFDNARGLSVTRGFEIADSSGAWHPACAAVDGETVVLTAPGVTDPSAVRYGWQPFTRADLVNAEGLPCSTFASSPATTRVTASGVKWTDASTLPLFGKAVENTFARYTRLPADMEGRVNSLIWRLGLNSAGLYVRFRSDSPFIRVRWTSWKGGQMPHMTDTGTRGLDLYALVDGKWRFVHSVIPSWTYSVSNDSEVISDMKPEMREYMLYLSLYDGIKSLEVGVDANSVIEGPAADLPASDRPIVIYGSSILQGCSASRPGMASTAIIGRELNREVINLGFSGSARLDYPIAELMAQVPDPALFVLDYVPNASVDEINERGETFFRMLRDAHPDVPVVFIEDPDYTHALFDTRMAAEIAAKNAAQKALFLKLKKQKEKKIYYVKGSKLLGDDGEGCVDGVHFTDVGMMRYVDAVLPVIRKALRK